MTNEWFWDLSGTGEVCATYFTSHYDGPMRAPSMVLPATMQLLFGPDSADIGGPVYPLLVSLGDVLTAQAAAGEIVFSTHAEIAVRVQRQIDDPNCSMEQLSKLIAADPLLAARTVGLANTVAFNPGGRAITDVKSAELIKYAANAMLATRISFMNELANLSEALGADIEMVRQGIGADPRIGYHFLYAGCGYGGSCFPKDVKALIKTGADAGHKLHVLNAVEDANDAQKLVLVDKIVARFGEDLSGKRFALWGLAFKPNTDDMRDAPSRVIIAELFKRGATVTAYDPVAMTESRRIFGNEPRLVYAERPMQALDNADALVIVTEWKEFRSPDFDVIKAKLKSPIIFDGRNIFDPVLPRKAGLTYLSIGRP